MNRTLFFVIVVSVAQLRYSLAEDAATEFPLHEPSHATIADKRARSDRLLTEQCRADTNNLITILSVLQAVSSVDQWAQTLGRNDYCTQQSDTKTTCVVDYPSTGHILEETCTSVGAIYMTTEFVFKCQDDNGMLEFYTAEDKPGCFGRSCGAEGAFGIQEEEVEQFRLWYQDQIGMSCTRMRLKMSDPIIPEQVPMNCDEDTEFIMSFFQNATDQMRSYIGTSPLTDYCLQQNTTWSCDVDYDLYNNHESMATECVQMDGTYLEADYTLVCNNTETDETMTVFSSHHPFCVSTSFCSTDDIDGLAVRNAQPTVDAVESQGWSCELAYSPFVENFAASSAPTVSAAPSESAAPSMSPTATPMPTSSPAPTASPTELDCTSSSIVLNQTAAVRDQTAAIQQAMQAIPFSSYCRYPALHAVPYVIRCDIDYGMIPNDMKSACEAQDEGAYVENTITLRCSNNDSKETQVTLTNRPACRSEKCNGLQLKQIDELELEWLRATLETTEVGYTCEIARVKVAMGGVEAMGSSDPSDECTSETGTLDTTISIYNAKSLTYADFKSLVAVNDLRDVGCLSPEVGYIECDIDFVPFRNGVQAECLANGGKYVESSFLTECQKGGDSFSMVSENVPSCISTICSPGQGLHALQGDSNWIANHYETQGYTCSATVRDIYTPNYEIGAAYNQLGNSGETPFQAQNNLESSADIESRQTEDPILQHGPTFGVIWITDAPTQSPSTMEPTDSDGEADSSSGCSALVTSFGFDQVLIMVLATLLGTPLLARII